MKEFFKQELEDLHAKTGIRQLQNMMSQPNGKEDVTKLIQFMIDECNKSPFDLVRQEVKERVISRAIVEDQDFIGLNAKFVRKALNAWWVTNGDRVIEAMNAKSHSVYERIELTPEQSRNIDSMAQKYIHELLNGDSQIKNVPAMDKAEIEQKGAEWISNIERKACLHPSTDAEYVKKSLLHDEWIRDNYDPYTAEKKPTWISEEEWLNKKA